MALKGTLKDFGIADIFQLIGQQQKTGVLHLTDGDEQVHVSFREGNVVKAESASRKRKELLGDMLVRAGLVGEKQLEEALEEQKRTLKRLGDILIAVNAISRESLREMAQLQTTETLYRLFFWKSGDYEFEVAEVEYDPETITPVRSESILMEGFRRVDEWPLIKKKITSTSMTFERAMPLPAAPAGAADEDDAALDDAFGEPAPKEEKKGDFKSLGPHERAVYALADPGRDVQFIVDRSRLGEFEACKALLNLLNLGYLSAATAAKPRPGGEVGTASGARLRKAVAAIGRVAGVLALGGIVAVVATLARARVEETGTGRRFSDPAMLRLAGRAQLSRVQSALAVFALERGALPEALDELVAAGILRDADLRYPWDESYHYRRTSPSTYVLLPPLR